MKKFLIAISSLFLLVGTALSAKTVKVASFNANEFIEMDSVTGERTGFAIDYLNALKNYTDWDYEYVGTDWLESFDLFKKGEVDIIPGISFVNERLLFTLYPNEKMGIESYFIYKSAGSKLRISKPQDINNKTIGLSRYSFLEAQLIRWLNINGVNCSFVYFDGLDDKKEALYKGSVDFICEADNYVTAGSGIVPLYHIGYSNYYIGVSINRPDLLQDLNNAYERIYRDNPEALNKIWHKYYPDTAVSEALQSYSKTKEEKTKDFLQQYGLRVFIAGLCIIAVLFVFIIIYIFLNHKRREQERRSNDLINQHMKILQSLADVYFTTHLFNLENDTFRIVKSIDEISSMEDKNKGNESLRTIMITRCSEPFLPPILEFCDLKTLPERMRGKKNISMEFIGKYNGWCRASFITVKTDDENRPVQVLFTTKIIEEEKRNQEALKKLSIIDSLSGLENRNSFEVTVKEMEQQEKDYSRTIFALDLNGLKAINDKYGHDAGDEVIIGAGKIIKDVFGRSGHCYRLGGDEFCVIISAEKPELDSLCGEFNKKVSEWKGQKVETLDISYGYASAYEYTNYDIHSLLKIADSRMYEMKHKFYKEAKS